MKIVFLQNTVDAQGGIVTVNRTLAEAFLSAGAEVFFLSLRHAPVRSRVAYPAAAHTELVNDRDDWDCPRYAEAAALLRAKKPAAALRHIGRRLRYDRALRRDYRACRARLSAIDPDIVINSHYELLDCIPPRLLPRTVNHFHTSFGQVLELKSYQATFRRYQNKIGKFVWLSQASCEAAKRFGLENSCCIYNPIAFSSEQTADLSVHRALFLGRFSPEKQLNTAVGIGHLWRGRIGRRLGGTDCRRFPRPLSGEHLHAARSLFAAQSVFDDFPFRRDAVGGIRSCGMRRSHHRHGLR